MLTKAKVYPQIWNLYRGQVCKYNCHVCHFWCRKKNNEFVSLLYNPEQQ